MSRRNEIAADIAEHGASEAFRRAARGVRVATRMTALRVVCDHCGADLGPCEGTRQPDGRWLYVWSPARVDTDHTCPEETP